MTGSKSRSDPLSELGRWARARVRVGGLLAGLVAAALLLAAQGAIERPLFDAYQRIFPPPAPSKDIVVVVIDSPSLGEIGPWPWPRYTMARLAEVIAGQEPRAIGFDFLFPERDRQSPAAFASLYPELSGPAAAEVRRLPSMDEVFAQVIGSHPVVLARLGLERDSFDTPDAPAEAPFPVSVPFEGPQPAAIPSYPATTANLSILDGSAAGIGLANGDTGPLVRAVPLLGRAAGVLTPSLALELVRVAEKDEAVRLEGTKDGLTAIRVGRHRVPVDAGGRLTLRYAGSPPNANGEAQAAYPTISAVNALRKGFDPHAFRNKIVLVGLAAAGTSDIVNTAREGRTFGVFVQAQAVDAIQRSAGLRRPAWAAPLEWGAALVLVLLAWFGVPRASLSLVAAGALAASVAAFGASAAAFQKNLILDPVLMLAPGVATAALMVTLLFVEGRRVQRLLRDDLEAQRRAADRLAGEMDAASRIQMAMLLPRPSLAAITPRAEVDAVLQPARSVGGDLYDAFMIDEDRLCFLVGDVTGKGVAAALFMALAKAQSHSQLTADHPDLGAAVAEINAELSRDNTEAMAVSLLVGVLNLADGGLDLVSAGHEHPLVIDTAGEVRELRLDGGLPLCIDESFPYPVETHALKPGETLVVLTDGVTEAQDPGGDLFGQARAMETLRGARPFASLVDRLVAAVRAFEAGGEPSDDLTVLALRLSAP